MSTPNRERLVEWFALALRILGMWQLLLTAEYVMSGMDMALGLYQRSGYTFGGAMVHMFGHFFLAVWLLKCAPKIADFFYPNATEPKRTDHGSDNS